MQFSMKKANQKNIWCMMTMKIVIMKIKETNNHASN